MFDNDFSGDSGLPGPNKPRPYPRVLSKSAKRWLKKHPELRDGWMGHAANLREGDGSGRKKDSIPIKAEMPKRGRGRPRQVPAAGSSSLRRPSATPSALF